MRRYSINSNVVQEWLAKESKLFLDISSRLDSENLFRLADNFSSYSGRISSLLKISEDENEDSVEVRVENPVEDRGEDIDLLFVDFVRDQYNNFELLDRANIYLSKELFYPMSGAYEILKKSGKNVYEGLYNLSKSLPSIFNIEAGSYQGVSVEAKTYEDFTYEQVSNVIYHVLFIYYSNDYLLEKNLIAREIIRDIIEDKVSKDTVALFAKLHKKKKNEVSADLSKTFKVQQLMKDILPEMSYELYHNFSERNFDLALPPFVEFSNNMKAVGCDVSYIKFAAKEVDRYLFLSRKYPKEYKYILENNLSSTFADDFDYCVKLSKLPDNFYNSLPGLKYYGAASDYIKNNPELFNYMSVNRSGNFIYHNSEYSFDNIWQMILLYGEESLYSDFDVSSKDQEYIAATDESSEFGKKLAEFPDSNWASRIYNDDYFKRFICYKCFLADKEKGIEFYYLYDIRQKDNTNSDLGSNILYENLLPIYINYVVNRKNMVPPIMGVAIVNKYYKLLGDRLLETTLPISYYPLVNLLERNASDEKVLEVMNSKEPRRSAQFYHENPFLENVSFEECLEFVRTRESGSIPSDSKFWSRDISVAIEYSDFNSVINLGAKVLYLLGEDYSKKYDSVIRGINSRLINSDTREFWRNFVLKFDSFIGNQENYLKIDSMVQLRHISTCAERFSSSEMYFLVDSNFGKMDQIFSTRQSISRSKNYSSIKFGSDEYEKLSTMITLVPEVRGRDPKLLMDLFDIGVSDKEYDEKSLFVLLSAASGIKEFPNFESDSFNIFRKIQNHIVLVPAHIEDMYNELYRNLFIKKESIINLGGFEVLFSKSADELISIFRIAPENQDVFRQTFESALRSKSSYHDYGLKLDFRIYKQKLLFYGFSELFKSFPEVAKFKKLTYKSIENYCEDIFRMVNNWDPDFVMNIYRMNINYPTDVKMPSYTNIGQGNIQLHVENLSNAGKIIRFFSKDAKEALNIFSIKYCQNAGYPVKGFDLIPSMKLKALIIHDMGNILPSDYYAYDESLAKYYIENLNKDLVDLKYVGDAWNNIIAILNDEMKFQERGFVREFAGNYDVSKLAEIIKRYASSELFKSMNVQSAKFGMMYIDSYKMPSNINSDSSGYKVLYSNLEKIYLAGQEVKMPSWSGFSSTVDGLTLRFLPREDPRGMFLGVITSCCQHPKSWAASCAIDGYLNPLACFAVFERNNSIVMQAYVWSDKNGNVCFDSVEGKATDSDMKSAKELMLQFARSIRGKCTVGSNKLGFNVTTDSIKNPSETNELPEIKSLLDSYTPQKNNKFYNADSSRQNEVK